jgi:integrase
MKKNELMSDSVRERDKREASEPKYLTQSEIQAILSVIHDEENRLLFLLGLDLGARVSEVVGLQWDRINWPNKFITIYDEKKDCWRTCTVSAATWQLLKAKKAKVDTRKQKLVFPMSAKTLNRRIKLWAKNANITMRVRWHTLRHTHIVQARRAGRDWNEISQQTGDTVTTLIQVYAKLSIEDRVDLTEKKPLIPNMESLGG